MKQNRVVVTAVTSQHSALSMTTASQRSFEHWDQPYTSVPLMCAFNFLAKFDIYIYSSRKEHSNLTIFITLKNS